MRSMSNGGEQVPGFRQRRGEALFLPERLLEALAKEEEEAQALRDRGEEVQDETARYTSAIAGLESFVREKSSGDSHGTDDPRPGRRRPRTSKAIEVFNPEELARGESDASKRAVDSDLRKRNQQLIRDLKRRGAERALAPLKRGWRKQLERLEAQFPNMDEVIDALRASFALAEHRDRTVRFAPVLLEGSPGIGKTFFAERLAGVLGTSLRIVRMEAQQSGGSLAGSDEFWSNSKTGVVFEALAYGRFANVLFFVDEIDKVSGDRRFDPLGALYQLLQPETAKTFRDLSVPWLTLDASRILWVTACNEPTAVPEPILSRLRRFAIPSPTMAQMRAMALRVFQELKKGLGRRSTLREPDEKVLQILSTLSPRQLRQVLQDGIGRALYAARDQVLPEDLRLPPEAGKAGAIGFIA